jgi:exodeoxyribonuclease-3
MRFATWNINGFKARKGYFFRWLEEIRPDVLGIQELKMASDQFPIEELAGLGYSSLVHGQKGWNGVAVLSREPAALQQLGLPGQEDLGARLLTAEVGGILFTTIYCPNGKSVEHPDFEGKLGWLDALGRYVDDVNRAGKPHVLCGDFNVVPTPIDSWSEERCAGKIFHTPDERARIVRLLGTGMKDVFRETRPEEPGFTWWDYRMGAFHRRQGLRIDLLLATDALAARVESVEADRRWRKKIDGMIPSDHIPVWADIDI